MPVAAPNIAPLFPASEIAGLNSSWDTGRTDFQFYFLLQSFQVNVRNYADRGLTTRTVIAGFLFSDLKSIIIIYQRNGPWYRILMIICMVNYGTFDSGKSLTIAGCEAWTCAVPCLFLTPLGTCGFLR
jgi:hypothetical protein